ncbi:putative aquaporin SIP2-1 [Cocos nucifera]|nr:putative aquaporin SIP2-1 [Cocos nucifera]
MARFGLVLWDLVLSFMWVWASALVKLFVYGYLEIGHRPEAEILKISLGVLYMFFFAWLGEVTRGGSYNPLTVLSYAFSGNLDRFLFTSLGRIPAQVSRIFTLSGDFLMDFVRFNFVE